MAFLFPSLMQHFAVDKICHIVAKHLHNLHSLKILLYFVRICSMYHIPICCPPCFLFILQAYYKSHIPIGEVSLSFESLTYRLSLFLLIKQPTHYSLILKNYFSFVHISTFLFVLSRLVLFHKQTGIISDECYKYHYSQIICHKNSTLSV